MICLRKEALAEEFSFAPLPRKQRRAARGLKWTLAKRALDQRPKSITIYKCLLRVYGVLSNSQFLIMLMP